MVSIVLTSVDFSCVPSGSQVATVEYKLAGTVGYTLVTNSATILSDGTFSPEVDISGLSIGECYEVRVTTTCGSIVKEFCTTLEAVCTQYTIILDSDTEIFWKDCKSTLPVSQLFLAGESPVVLCSLEDPTGSFVSMTNDGQCPPETTTTTTIAPTTTTTSTTTTTTAAPTTTTTTTIAPGHMQASVGVIGSGVSMIGVQVNTIPLVPSSGSPFPLNPGESNRSQCQTGSCSVDISIGGNDPLYTLVGVTGSDLVNQTLPFTGPGTYSFVGVNIDSITDATCDLE